MSEENRPDIDVHEDGEKILLRIKAHMGEIGKFLRVDEHEPKGHGFEFGEDPFYRFYHQSFKVYGLQNTTKAMVELMEKIGQESEVEAATKLNPWFLEIIQEGTGKTFDFTHNEEWTKHTRPIVEAFFHAREMLRCMHRYGQKLAHAPNSLPSGWGSVLYLYNIR
jgi:hypothetical protein